MFYLNSSWLTIFLVLSFGLIVGSFLGVCIKEFLLVTFWKSQRSFVPACGKTIPFYLNIPLFSYLLLK